MIKSPPQRAIRSVGTDGNPVAFVVARNAVTVMNFSNDSLKGAETRLQRFGRNVNRVVPTRSETEGWGGRGGEGSRRWGEEEKEVEEGAERDGKEREGEEETDRKVKEAKVKMKHLPSSKLNVLMLAET